MRDQKGLLHERAFSVLFGFRCFTDFAFFSESASIRRAPHSLAAAVGGREMSQRVPVNQ
jgi:hypothetical protein